MAAATLNATDKVQGVVGLTVYDLTFAASGDTFTITLPVRQYNFCVYAYGAANASANTHISQSSGVFTCTDATNTAIGVYLWVLEKK